MTNYLVTDTELTTVANSIREKCGTTANLSWPTGYVNAVNDIETGGNAYAVISVTYPSGSTCTCVKGSTILTAEGTGGLYNFLVPEAGNWTVSCTNGTDTTSINCTITLQYQNENITLTYSPQPGLNNNSWKVISQAAQAGTGDTYWDIGDRKQIILNGKIGDILTLSNFTTYVFILDFNYPVNKSTAENNIIFGGFKTALSGGVDICLVDSYNSGKSDGTKTFNINHMKIDTTVYNSTYGGWKGCDFRYDILGTVQTAPTGYNSSSRNTNASGYDATTAAITSPKANTLMSALPSDFRNVLRLWTRWVDNKGSGTNTSGNVTACIDAGISLLAEFEIFNTRQNANSYEQSHQKQITYYKNGNSKIKYKHNGISTAARWWSLSPSGYNKTDWCFVTTDGTQNWGWGTATSNGLAPAFKI